LEVPGERKARTGSTCRESMKGAGGNARGRDDDRGRKQASTVTKLGVGHRDKGKQKRNHFQKGTNAV